MVFTADPVRNRTTSSDRLGRRSSTGVTVDLCREVEHVEQCWQLVYRSYLQAGIIGPNPFGLHTHRWACTPGAGIIRARMSSLTVATLAAFPDAPGDGLPLDEVYPRELDQLRRRGRRLMEVGLFADRRETRGSSLATLMEIMRHLAWFALHSDIDDLLIGVHPHHAPFYQRAMGFKRFADRDTACPHAGDAPLVPLRLDIPADFHRPDVPRGLAMVKANPLGPEMLGERVILDPLTLAGTRLQAYLDTKPTSLALAVAA